MVGPVVYGDPTPETMERAQRRDVILGGCMPELPVERPCPTCGLPVVVSESEGSRWGSGVEPGDA
jgi:hypothetical protein